MVAKGIVKHISHISVLLLIYNGEKFIKGRYIPLYLSSKGKFLLHIYSSVCLTYKSYKCFATYI